MIKRTWCCKFA